jgi:hypothetical protein
MADDRETIQHVQRLADLSRPQVALPLRRNKAASQ